MGGLDFIELDFEELLKKKSILSDKHHATATKKTTQGVLGQNAGNLVTKGNSRAKHNIRAHRDDVQNIGSGTRCMKCGMLHFMWTPNCHACGIPMFFNMARDEKGRRIC